MDELVTQNIEPIKQDTQYDFGFFLLKRMLNPSLATCKPLFPVIIPINPIMVLPKRIEDVLVVQ